MELSQALGMHKGFELALKYSQEENQFSKCNCQIGYACKNYMFRLLIHKAATEKRNGEDIAHSGAMAGYMLLKLL